MRRTVGFVVAGGAILAVAGWTLAVVGAWWLVQAAATAVDGGSPGTILQSIAQWTERHWVRLWLEPHEAMALRDGVDWLFGLGGGPAVWLGSALGAVGVALVVVWAAGLLLGGLVVVVTLAVLRWLARWFQGGPRLPWPPRKPDPSAGQPTA